MIATHVNTDFDAFGSLLAARCLYPGSTAVLPSVLNRNVREFARLHADELRCAEPARIELDAIRRLVVVETVHAARLGELEPVALDPGVEKVVFDHHAARAPRVGAARERRALLGRGPDDDARRDPGRARDRRHAARGDGVRARHPRGHGLAHVHVLDPARRRGARLVPSPRRAPGGAGDVPAHAALGGGADADERAARGRGDTSRVGRRDARRRRLLAPLRRGHLAPRAKDHRRHRLPGARAPRRDGRTRLRGRAQPHRRARRRRCGRDAGRRRAPRRRRRRSSAAASKKARKRFVARPRRRDPQAAPRPRRHGPARPVGRCRTRPSPRRWSPASATGRAASSSPRTAASSDPCAGRTWTRRSATASRTPR